MNKFLAAAVLAGFATVTFAANHAAKPAAPAASAAKKDDKKDSKPATPTPKKEEGKK
ncbi:MAG: hypothetical protein ACOVQT_09100 [Rubrivivax sp.]|jgi:hypothetical protein